MKAGIDNAVVLISFPVGAMSNPKALRAFISTDVSLSTQEILRLYVNRWEIEVFFRACKTKLAFDRYQIRSAKGIKRFWILTALAYFLACSQSKSFHFPNGFNLMAKTIHSEHIRFIYEFGKSQQVSKRCCRFICHACFLIFFVHFHDTFINLLIYRGCEETLRKKQPSPK